MLQPDTDKALGWPLAALCALFVSVVVYGAVRLEAGFSGAPVASQGLLDE